MIATKILYVCCYCITGYIVFDFLNSTFGKKTKNFFSTLVAYFAFVAGYTIISDYTNILGKSIFGMLFTLILGYILYNSYSKKNIYICIFMLYLSISDTLTTLLSSFLLSVHISEFPSNFRGMVISIVLGQSFMLATYKFVKKFLMTKFIDRVTWRECFFQLVFAGFQMVAIYYSTWAIQKDYANTFLMFLTLGFIGSDIYTMYLYYNLSEHNKLKERQALEKQQQLLLSQYYHEMDAKFEESRKNWHDMKEHIQIIENLYKTQDSAEGHLYAQKIYNKIDNLGYTFECNNKILSAIINDVILRTQINRIDFNIKIQNLNWDFIDSIDITTLFSNILNNAIDACIVLNNSPRWIKLNVYNRNQNIVINCANSCLEESFLIETRKTSKQGHAGIGLINISNTVERYGGIYDAACNNFIFEVKISIPTPN